MAAEDETALEPKEEVLPDRLHPVESPAVEPFGKTFHRRSRMRRLDFDVLTHERLEPPGRAMERIPFRHAGKPTIQP
jgi:hypothetical protein